MKKRVFYLDFIRAIATISILITHFNALYIYYYPEHLDKAVLFSYPFNIYIGGWGVALFFAISGAALMYVYQEKIDIKNYVKKRFFSIYPMFWIAYVTYFFITFYRNKGLLAGVPKKNIIFSVLGIDGLMAGLGLNVPTFYMLGEWFLGFILLLYVIFPVLRWGVLRYPKITAAILLGLYAVTLFGYKGNLNPSCFVTTRLPEFALGMYLVAYHKKIKLPEVIFSVLILILNSILKPAWDDNLQVTYVGAATYIILVYVAQLIQNFKMPAVRFLIDKVSKYSFAVFLVHHVVMYDVALQFDLAKITRSESYLLFVLCVGITIIAAKILFMIHQYIMELTGRLYEAFCVQK